MEDKRENICPVCFADLDDKSNFCGTCGEPISDVAKELEKDKKLNAQIEILVKIMDFLSDEKDLKFIKGLVGKLADEQ